jgi:tetratricopeptide (TPR) repeat protein
MIRERLVRDQPTVTEYQNDLAENYNYFGFILNATGHPADALKSCLRALEISERLAHDHPSVHSHQSGLGISLNNIATLEMRPGQWPEAREHLERAIAYQRAALAMMPRHPVDQQALRAHQLNLMKVYHTLNKTADATRMMRELEELARGKPTELYDVACAVAASAPLARGEQRQALETEAVQTLRVAVAAGWIDARHTARDPDLAPLHDRDDFRRLLAALFDRGFPANPFAP